MNVEERLSALGITLPAAPAPAANYVPRIVTGNQLWIAGQAPIRDGRYPWTGQVGGEVSPANAREAARLCGINLLAQVKAGCDGDWARLVRAIRVCGYVSAAPGFFDLPQVLDGCSDVLVEVLGDSGKHVRTVVGVAALRFNVPIVVDAVFEVRA